MQVKLRNNCYTAIFIVTVMLFVTLFSGCQEKQQLYEDVSLKEITASNDNLTFSIDDMGHFEFKDNNSGKVWYSVPQDRDKDTVSKGLTMTDTRSELIIEYLSRKDENTSFTTQKSNSYVMCESGGSVKVSENKNGYSVLYDFAEIGIKIPVNYKLEGSYLKASVDINGIDEGKENYLVTLEFLPYFGAAGADKNGYLFIPDGCGAVAEFNQNIKPLRPYEKRIYGNDPAHSDEALTSKETEIKLPVFGMVYGNSALMGIVADGDGAASILAETGSDSVYYNSVRSKMIYRISAKDNALYKEKNKDYIYTVTHTDFGVDEYTVKYFTLSGDNASYSGMAHTYQKYLTELYSMEKSKHPQGLAVRAYAAIEEKKNFLGITYYKKSALTTFEQMQEILADLKENDIENISVQYLGWSGDGVINRKLPINAKPLKLLGGKKQFEFLKSYAEKNNVELTLDADILRFKKSGNGVSVRNNATKAPNGDVAKIYEYSKVTYAKNKKLMPDFLLSSKYIGEYFSKYLGNYKKLKNDSISFSSLGNTVYSDFKNNSGMYRTKSIKEIQKLLQKTSKEYKNLTVTGGNAYVIPFADCIYDVPVSSSNYDIFSYDVPFYHMVVNGYVSYTAPRIIQSVDYNTMFLKAVETRSSLLFDCVYVDASVLRDTELSSSFSSQYDIWKERAISSYNEIQKIYDKTEGSTIVKHCRISDGVYEVTYSNNIKIYVNYNSVPITVNEITVPDFGYAIKEAAA